MIKVSLEDCNGNVNKMLSKFKKKVRESKLIIELNERKRYVSKKEKQKKKRAKSEYKRKQKDKEENFGKI